MAYEGVTGVGKNYVSPPTPFSDEKRYARDFAKRFYAAFSERLQNPSNASSGALFGLIKPKRAASDDAALEELGYTDAQKGVIRSIKQQLDRDLTGVDGAELIATMKDLILQGRAAFPVGVGLPFQRLARFFATGNDKKGFGIIKGGTPMWYTSFMPQQQPQAGGRRRRTGRKSRRNRKAYRKSRRAGRR